MGLYRDLCFAICLLCIVNVATAEVVGLTEGEFRVDESGAATYILPIATPAGRAGVTPSVALSYSSNNMAEGPVGVGWSISGMSSISRCPPTPIHDNKIQAVQYTNQDKLCMGGTRLILISGSYLAPDSVYRFEVDDFSEITARGGSSINGPQYFEVKNKAGEVHYYGDSDAISFMFYDHDDAFIEPGGSAAGVKAKMWMLKVVKDIKGNFILYNYTKDTAKGSLYLNNIEYSGSLSQYKSPFAKIQFIYKDYEKGFKGYYAGAHSSHDKLLERIDTIIDDDIYRSYFLRYEESDFIEERTLLTSVQECSDNDATRNCRKPTTFEWQRPVLATGGTRQVCETEPGTTSFCYDAPYSTNYNPFPSSGTISNSAPNRYTTQVFDINGDGFQDLVYVDGSYWYAKLANSYGLGSPQRLSSIGTGKKDYAMNMDYNGDGVRDLLVANNDTSNWYAISYQPSVVTTSHCGYAEPCEDFTYTSEVTVKNLGVIATGLEGGAQVMDVNGDGNEDIVFRTGKYLRTHLNDGDGTFASNKLLYTFASKPSFGGMNEGYLNQSGDMKSASQIDVNGDGRSDLIMKVTTTSGGCYYRDGRFIPFASGPGDCRDMGGTWRTQRSTKNHVYLATGSLLAPSLTELTSFSGYIENVRVADFNGDGLSDLAYVSNNKWYYRLSNGKILLAPKEMGMTTAANRKHLTQFVDLNGDGRADVLHATSTSNWQIYFSRPTSTGEWISFQYRGNKPFDNNAVIRFGDVNGDGKIDMLTSTGGSWKQYYSRKNIKEYVISKITTGFGVPTTIFYQPMTNATLYVMQASDENLNSDTLSPISGASLVRQVNTQSNVGSTSSTLVSVSYQYGGLLLHKKGRGSLGFQLLRTTDLQTDVVSETQYSQKYSGNDFATLGMPVYSEQRRNGHLLSQATNTLATQDTAQGGLSPYVSSSEELGYVYNSNGTSTHLSTTVTTHEIDTWGNPTLITITTTDEGSNHYIETETINAWGNSNEQRYGRLKQTTVVKNRTGDENNKTRISTFSYGQDMLLAGSIVSPTSASTKLTSAYRYNLYGSKTQTSVTGYLTSTGSNQTRVSTVAYDTHGRYIDYEENGLGEKNTYKYNGQPASSATGVTDNVTSTGPNGIATRTYFDDFQQVRFIDYPDSKYAYTIRSFCEGCVTNGYFKITETLSGAPTKETYFDRWGRAVTSQVKGFDGSWWTTHVTYDDKGKQTRVYEPNSTLYTETIYDDVNRPEEIRHPNGSKVYQYYNGTESRTTDELGRYSYIYSNGFGETTSTRDMLDNTVTFTYDAFGNLTNTRTRAHNKNSDVTNIYDIWGRKTQMTDPVKGTWNFTYNAFGELFTQRTARNQITSFNYDKLGRMIRRYEPSEGTSCWVYGTTAALAQKAVGKLLSKSQYGGSNVSCSSPPVPTIQKRYEYDSLGRVNKSTTQLGYTPYHQSQTYDSYSRPNMTTFPAGTVAVAAKTHYNSHGYGYKTSRVGDNYVLSEVMSMNSRGQVTQRKNGNAVTTTYGFDNQTGWLDSIGVAKSTALLHSLNIGHDVKGNVTSRRSNYASSNGIGSDFTETYTYDTLNRLKVRTIGYTAGSSSLPTAFKGTHTYDYDNWGNFTFKTGAGYYKYDSVKVHELSGVYTNANFTGTKYAFIYDENGNVENDGSRTFTYASFDKPTRITKGTASSDMKYGVDRDLYYKVDNTVENGSSVSYKRYYIGAYEKVVRTGGNGNMTEHKYNIGNAVLTYRDGSNTTSFIHADNQGSVIATTNHVGLVTTQDIYDPFGKQSEVYRASVYITSLPPITDKGYTGHKQMNHVDVIHMNGRIYDPTLGRFLQADPFIQAPLNSQNYNRYSYVLNNPMSYTDPTGYFFSGLRKKIKKYWKADVAIGVTIATYGAASGWAAGWGMTQGFTMTTLGTTMTYTTGLSVTGALTAGAIAGAAGGFVGGALQTGSFRGALKGAFGGAIAGAAGGYANFGSVAGWGNVAARISVSALGGCAAGKASGGSCGQGAKMAAMMQSLSVGMEMYSKYKPTWKTADGESVVKFKGDGVQNDAASNIGKSIEVVKDGTADHLVGRSLSSLTAEEANLLLRNNSENFGKITVNNSSVRFTWDTEGSRILSSVANNVPGMNSMAVFHDVWMAKWNAQNALLLGGTVVPALYINYQALGLGYQRYLNDSLDK
jgi:RHS repeat-associated protein